MPGALVPAFLVAALLLAQLPGHGVARVIAAMACANATVLAAGVAAEWLAQHQLSGAGAIRWVAAVSWAGTLPLVPVLMLRLFDGEPLCRWRPVLWAQLATVAVLAMLSAIGVGEVPAGLEPLAALSGVVLLGSGVLAVVRRVVGWRAAARVEPAQLRGFAIVCVVIALGYLLGGLLLLAVDDVRHVTGDALLYLTMVAGLPVAVGGRSATATGITRWSTGCWCWWWSAPCCWGPTSGIVAAVTALLGGSRVLALVTLVAAVVVVLALAPVRVRAQRLVDQLTHRRPQRPGAHPALPGCAAGGHRCTRRGGPAPWLRRSPAPCGCPGPRSIWTGRAMGMDGRGR